MNPVITNEHLDFLYEARGVFIHNKNIKTYRNAENTLIALRREITPDFDDIEIYKIDNVAKFIEQVKRNES